MLPAGTRLGPYEVLTPLGRGGMGEVYRARDLRLDRDVAIKVLPEGTALDPQRLARFEREARAVAALAHPNILVLYDIGREQGIPYAVMELLEGTTLRGRLAGTTLPWREVLEIGAAVAEGLAAAHAKGIIHRDIKPENLFLTTSGAVKILDFGLARVEAQPSTQAETVAYDLAHTALGSILGTVGYMAPEQIRGLVVDARGDLFALGCVLYEAMAGRHPFRRPTAADTAAAILHDEAPALSKLGVSVPEEVERIVCQCLAKEPARRFPSARDLAFALSACLSSSGISPGLPPTAVCPPPRRRRAAIPSLAVLPLVNATADPDTEYLSDGLTESIINCLSQLPGLRVMARSSVFRYKGQDADVREVGRALKVRAVLTGRLFQRGPRLILRAELVDVRTGTQLWGAQYDRPLAEILALEEVVAQEIAEKLHQRLTGDQKRRLVRPRTANAEAYQCYLKGRYHWNKRTAEGLKKSITWFEQALEHDPTYAAAYAGIADAYLNLGGWGHVPFREAYPLAKAAAARALAIDDTLAEAHVSLAMVQKEYDWDWVAAGRGYERALALNPGYAVAHQWYGEYLAALGRHDEAIAALQRAAELDPLSLIIQATLGRHGYYAARRYGEAIAQLRKTLELGEDFWVAHLWLSLAYAQAGQLPEAVAEARTACHLDDNPEALAGLGYALGLTGQRREAEETLTEAQRLSSQRYVSPVVPALILIGLGEHSQALDWLERAHADRAQMMSELRSEPAFDPLRADPRFADLLHRVGLGTAPGS